MYCADGTLRPDKWMNQRNTRAMACMCAGYAWEGVMTGAMHRRGSLRCWYRADGSKREHGDKDYFVDPMWLEEMNYG